MKRLAAHLALIALLSGPAHAADLFKSDSWSAMATDRSARRVGDILTVVVYESATASNSASSSSNRGTQVGGQVSGSGFNYAGNLGLHNNSDNSGMTGRSGGMVAQISVTVDSILPNGDLQVSGAQELNINGDKTNIRIKGRVRQADIANNAVLSNRLADAIIDYDGVGFVSSSAKPGLVTRLFNWLGLI